MATYNITISDKTPKTRHLIGLIREMSKTEAEFIQYMPMPNNETIEAINDVENGKVIRANDKEDFFSQLEA